MSEESPGPRAKLNTKWLALGVATKNIAIGIGLGVAIGFGLAVAIPRKK